MKGLHPQLSLLLVETVVILSPQSCDEVNERLRAMALDEEEEEDDEDEEEEGTLRTPIEAIEAIQMAFRGLY